MANQVLGRPYLPLRVALHGRLACVVGSIMAAVDQVRQTSPVEVYSLAMMRKEYCHVGPNALKRLVILQLRSSGSNAGILIRSETVAYNQSPTQLLLSSLEDWIPSSISTRQE